MYENNPRKLKSEKCMAYAYGLYIGTGRRQLYMGPCIECGISCTHTVIHLQCRGVVHLSMLDSEVTADFNLRGMFL